MRQRIHHGTYKRWILDFEQKHGVEAAQPHWIEFHYLERKRVTKTTAYRWLELKTALGQTLPEEETLEARFRAHKRLYGQSPQRQRTVDDSFHYAACAALLAKDERVSAYLTAKAEILKRFGLSRYYDGSRPYPAPAEISTTRKGWDGIYLMLRKRMHPTVEIPRIDRILSGEETWLRLACERLGITLPPPRTDLVNKVHRSLGDAESNIPTHLFDDPSKK